MIGEGSIKLTKVKGILEITDFILSLTNSAKYVREKRLAELQNINSTKRALTVDVLAGNTSINDPEVEILDNKVIREYVIKNTLGIISATPSYNDKVNCIIFLLTKMLHITFKEIFKLDENVSTEYQYINTHNKKINRILKEITDEVYENSKELDVLTSNFKKSIKPEIYDYLFENYTEKEFMSFRTGNFYKALRRAFGESFTEYDKQKVSDFLANYKQIRKKLIVKPISYYCEKFGITEESYKDRLGESLKILIQLSSEDLITISSND